MPRDTQHQNESASRSLHARARSIHGNTHDCNEKPNIGLGELISDQIISTCEHFLKTIERLEERDNGIFIRLLTTRKTRFVHAVFGRVVNERDSEVDISLYVLFTVW